jgi:hypothetical protein
MYFTMHTPYEYFQTRTIGMSPLEQGGCKAVQIRCNLTRWSEREVFDCTTQRLLVKLDNSETFEM